MRGWLGFDSPFMSFLNKIMNLLVLNFCFLLCCIPVVTIGAGMTALYAVNLKMVRNEEPPVWRGFWKEFRANFKQSTISFLIFLAVGLMLIWNYRIMTGVSEIPAILLGIIIFIVGVIYILEFLYLFPYIARFKDSLRVCVLNALLIGVSRFAYTLTFFLMTTAVFLLMLSDMELLLRCLILWLTIGFAGMNYLYSVFFRKLFDRYS